MPTRHTVLSTTLSRRAFLGGAAAAITLATSGCQSREAPAVSPPVTVPALLDGNPFYIAHRGGGSDWPELTTYAYQQAVKLPGLKAVEVSVALSSDGVLVCSHDATTGRLTEQSYVISKTPWSTLAKLTVSAAETRDPKQPSQPFSKLDDVLNVLSDNFVVFIEPKTSIADVPLMKRLMAWDQPQRVVWKQPINSQRFAEAKRHGFSTWGYVLNDPAHLGANLTRYAADPAVDMLGAPLAESDKLCDNVVSTATSNGKLTVAFTVSSATDRQRALGLGCRGLMVSAIRELLPPPN